MSNVNRPFGLKPVGYLNGAPWTGGGRVYCILQANAQKFAIGDPVTLGGTADGRGIANVVLATAGTGQLVTGVVVGMGGSAFGAMYADPDNLSTIVIPATKTRNYYVLVVDDPNVIFEIQDDNSGTPLAAADVGVNVNLKSGADNGYVSGWTLDNASKGTGATLQCKLLGLAPRSDNIIAAAGKWLVTINHHSYRAGVAGV